MQFDLVGFIFNSLVLLFFTMTLGNLFGDIKFRKFNFGITGTLFIGLIVGYFLTKYAVTITEGSKYFSKTQNAIPSFPPRTPLSYAERKSSLWISVRIP